MVLSRLGCSTVQLGIKVIDYFLGYRLPEYTFGKGALEKLPQILKEKDAGKVLVVTEAGLVELGFAKKLTDLLDEAGIEYAFYSGAEKNPTTSGTGSETTVAAVITDSKTRRKAAINDPVLIPRYAILDPELTATLPPFITATTGMDALSHAVESYTNHMYNTKTEDILAKKAVQLIHDNLYKAYLDGSDMTARENMQIAALYAGRAFTRGCVGYVHAVGHTLGGLYGVPHGLAMAILLPHVMRAFGPVVHKRLAELATVCGMTGENDAEKAEKFISWIEEMNRKMGIPEYLDMIKDEDVEQIITWAMREANPLYPTPVLWGRKELRKFIASVRR